MLDTYELMKNVFGEAKSSSLALMCGPPPMIEKAVKPGFEKLGFQHEQNLFSF
jgi:NAD(P)H-flavin reductase